MSEHYSSNTLSQTKWCNTCSAFTPHAVSGHKVGHCLTCAERKQQERAEELAIQRQQPSLFGADPPGAGGHVDVR